MPGTLPGGGDYSVTGDSPRERWTRIGNLPEGLRLPESLAQSGDPVEGNPYPTEHPAHQVWIDATRQAEMEVSRINSDASSLLTPATADEWMPTQVVAKFDVWARRGVQVVWTDDAVRQYDAWLVGYANAWIESVSRLLTSHAAAVPTRKGSRRLTSPAGRSGSPLESRGPSLSDSAGSAAPPLPRRRVQGPQSRTGRSADDRAVQKYRDDHDLDAVGFARTVGISETVGQGHHQGGSERGSTAAPRRNCWRSSACRERIGTESDDARFPPVLLPFTPVFSRSSGGPSGVRRRSAGAAPRWLAPTRATESCCPCPPAGGFSDTSATACPTPKWFGSAINCTCSLNLRSPPSRRTLAYEPEATVLGSLSPDVREEVEERAAILQFDAHLPRGLATRAAVAARVTAEREGQVIRVRAGDLLQGLDEGAGAEPVAAHAVKGVRGLLPT